MYARKGFKAASEISAMDERKLPATDFVGDLGLPDVIGTCALVGESATSTLSGQGLGNLIDDHDVVVRVNKAVVAGFEADVGRKTTGMASFLPVVRFGSYGFR